MKDKVSKVIIAILCISILFAGGVYATAKIVESFSGKAKWLLYLQVRYHQ